MKFVALVESINEKQVPAVHLRPGSTGMCQSIDHFSLEHRRFCEILSSDTVWYLLYTLLSHIVERYL